MESEAKGLKNYSDSSTLQSWPGEEKVSESLPSSKVCPCRKELEWNIRNQRKKEFEDGGIVTSFRVQLRSQMSLDFSNWEPLGALGRTILGTLSSEGREE